MPVLPPGLSPEFLEPILKAELSKHKFLNLGGFLFGALVDATLFGMMMVMLGYWVSYVPKERLHVKVILVWVVLCAIACTGYNCHLIWYHFIQNFGKWTPFVMAKWVGWWAIFDTITVIPVQAFYAERAFRLMGNNWWLLGVIVLGMACQASASIAVAVITATTPGFEQVEATKAVVYIWLTATLFVDLCLTGSIIYGLLKSKTGYSETSRLINRLVMITVESSLAATLAAVGFMINYCICGSDNLFMLFWEMFHPKLYVIPFIAVLNSRLDLQRGFTSNGVSADSDATFALSTFSQDPTHSKLEQIKIDTTTVREEHPVLPYRVGLNRRTLDDASSIGAHTAEHGDSSTALNTFESFRPRNPF
ncbi:hypothetical protein FFLO_03317 [Filobasidium floriforme]|uniref:DUF6534 domain-containing protein n=1 Tax=Filobasidium floriforme TaxID=5210 RepID=A0A8K0NQD1_9TREE|nr:hypothetical protein FFLO_03317 [Filobasidium floriforme]